jgi:hypothetical protein
MVPTVRFIPTLDQSVVRVRTPADLWLLLLRMAIVACAAVALARPLLLTEARTAAWADRIARVVVVDVSESVGEATGAEAAAAELQSATFAHRIDAAELAPALRRASAWLEAVPPARREIVIVSDFQRGALVPADVDAIPEAIGIRFIPMRSSGNVAPREISAGSVLAEDGAFRRTVRLDDSTTSGTFTPAPAAFGGLRLLTAPEDADGAAFLLRVVSRAGAHAPSGPQPVVVRFPGGFRLQAEGQAEQWPREAALRLLREADRNDLPLTVAADAEMLLVDVIAAPGSLAAAEAVKAALDARPDPRALAEQEVARVPAATLSAWTREPGAPDPAAWQQSNESDGRWLWLAALVLLGIETVVRRSQAAAAQEADVRAA